jgi:hypothetical protein
MDHMMTTESFDRSCGERACLAVPQPVVFTRAGLAGELALTEGASTLAVFAHATAAGRDHPGHRFVGDVLRANGVATLSIGLRTAEEEACGAPLAGVLELTLRMMAVLDSLAASGVTRPLHVALIGIGAAAASCAIVARQPGLEAIRSVVLLDGRVDRTMPRSTPGAAPRCASPAATASRCRQPLAGVLAAAAGLLRMQPLATAGAFQAMACQLAAWLQPRCGRPHEAVSSGVTELASAQ